MEVEHVDFISVPVTDLQRSTAWYRDTLGLPQTGEGGFPEFRLGDNVFLYLIDPTSIGGTFTKGHGSPIALRVADVAETRSELEGRGIEFSDEPYDTGVCHMAPFDDPDGNRFMLHRRYAPHES
ncbi:MAG TPA: VOC family protein [Gaiellaceae bacterium]|nr:VOC family protein [Gaiellaceae bacterium]